MDELSRLLALSEEEKTGRGLVHTPREIYQQPDTWRRTYEKLSGGADGVRDFLARAGLSGGAAPTIYLVGAGTSDYIGRALTSLLRREWRCEVQAVPSTDLLTDMDEHVIPGRPYLWVSFSRSGDSSEGVAVIEAALERHPSVRHLIVTCNGGGRMARDFGGRENVFCLVLDDAVNDRGLAMTSSFTNMVVAGQCLAHVRDLGSYGRVVEDLAGAAERFTGAAADAAARLAAERLTKFCFLGTGALRAVAVESALKVLELTAGRVYTWSESYLGVRHGPLSAVDGETLVVGFLSGDRRRRAYELDLLREVKGKRLAGRIIAVCPAGAPPSGEFDDSLSLALAESFDDLHRPPLDVIFGQLFGLFNSLAQNLKPDTPSPKGAISRVVERVRIH
ncbi:MAG: SIS domain-containing protein [Pyrinomonadaceae bacterium]